MLLFDRHSVQFNTGIEMTSNEAIRQAVEAGSGLGIVSIHTIEPGLEAARLKVLDVEDFPIGRDWYILNRKGKWLSPAVKAFEQFGWKRPGNLFGCQLDSFVGPPTF